MFAWHLPPTLPHGREVAARDGHGLIYTYIYIYIYIIIISSSSSSSIYICVIIIIIVIVDNTIIISSSSSSSSSSTSGEAQGAGTKLRTFGGLCVVSNDIVCSLKRRLAKYICMYVCIYIYNVYIYIYMSFHYPLASPHVRDRANCLLTNCGLKRLRTSGGLFSCSSPPP